MNFEHDIVIIGGTTAGRYAAIAATQLGATVALVEPKSAPAVQIIFGDIYHRALAYKLNHAPENWAEAILWAEAVVSNLEQQNSPAVLAALGVDVIFGAGQFEGQPHLAFIVNNRRLEARNFLIATGSCPAIPKLEGLQSTGYLLPTDVWRLLNTQNPPQDWVILGSNPISIELAKFISQTGLNVKLIVKHSQILPQEDPEIAQLIQATLDSVGVRVLTETTVTQVKLIEGKKWIQAGDKAIESDEIVLCGRQVPNVGALNLAAVGVKSNRDRLLVNDKLQTTNARIYACGDVLGGYQLANIANYEAQIALKNALFFPKYKVDYRSIPWTILSHPQLAGVGLTEAQARRRYPDVLVLQQYFKTVAAAQITDETTGICKLVVRRNGKILGAAIVGSQASELINLIALAIAQNLKVDAIASLAPVYSSFSEILSQTASTGKRD